MPIDDDLTNADPKIIKGDFSQETTKKNKLITDAASLEDPAIRFTALQWCDAFEMFQFVLWERMTNPKKYMNLPDEAMKQMIDISKKLPPSARFEFDVAWKTLKKDLLEFGLHGAEHFVTVCVDGINGETPGYNVFRRADDYTEDDQRFEPDALFVPFNTWQAAGARFFDWYGQQCNALDPSKAIRNLLSDKGIKTEEQFLNSDLGRDGLIANPF